MFNEEAVIPVNVPRIISELQSRADTTWELICINDGSDDGTGELLDEFAKGDSHIRVVHHRRNVGQGRALRSGFEICRGEYIVTLDADLSYGPEHTYRLVDALEAQQVEIALASPYLKGGAVRNLPLRRYVLSWAANRYLKWMSGESISTSTCVVRAYRREVIDELILTSDGMELQIEILMKALMLGYRVGEIPATLQWSNGESRGGQGRRMSKMRVMQTVQIYFFLGWLSRPAFILSLLAVLLLLPGCYMALLLGWRIAGLAWLNKSHGFLQAFSAALRGVYAAFPATVVVSGVALIIGIQMIVFSFMVLQAKYHFEEIFRLEQQVARKNKRENR